MKKLPSVKAVMALIAILLVNICSATVIDGNKKINNSETIKMDNYLLVSHLNGQELFALKTVNNELLAINEEIESQEEIVEEVPEIIFDGMTLEELAQKLDKNLKSTLTGYGMVFAKYALEYEVDPYLALAIVLHETGCNSGKCSTLTSSCNNIGGMKGSNKCGNGPYAKFASLDEGINAFFRNLSKNYYQKGLNTPEKIGKKYAESSTWASRIRFYMNKIKNS